MREIVLELAGEQGLHSLLALLRSGQGKAYLKRRYREGRILPLNRAPPISEAVIDRSVLKLDGLIVGFETRKVVFGRYVKEKEALREAIRTALRFEYLGCQLRRETYLQLYREDEDKTRTIEAMRR